MSDFGTVSNRRQGRGSGYNSDMEIHSRRHRGAYNTSPQNRDFHRTSPGKAPTAYSNIPMSPRSAIGNDELYEQGARDNLLVSTAQQASHRSSTSQLSATDPMVRRSNIGLSQPPEERKPSGGGAGGDEDAQWREQLYKASIKLQKSPSDRRVPLQVIIVTFT
jgi:hypothetical protein